MNNNLYLLLLMWYDRLELSWIGGNKALLMWKRILFCKVNWACQQTREPPVNLKDLWALIIVGLTRKNPIMYPLAVVLYYTLTTTMYLSLVLGLLSKLENWNIFLKKAAVCYTLSSSDKLIVWEIWSFFANKSTSLQNKLSQIKWHWSPRCNELHEV